jgi:hypothetical protein
MQPRFPARCRRPIYWRDMSEHVPEPPTVLFAWQKKKPNIGANKKSADRTQDQPS